MPPVCSALLSSCREIALIGALAIILTTMVIGIMILGLLNIPQSFWDSRSIVVYLGMFTIHIRACLRPRTRHRMVDKHLQDVEFHVLEGA